MSGHFLLENITSDEMDEIQNVWISNSKKCPLLTEDVMHAEGSSNKGSEHVFAGWNVATRAELEKAKAGTMGDNREQLPPHKYFTFAVGEADINCAKYLKKNQANGGWVSRILAPNMGLKEMNQSAATLWKAGNKWEAITRQIFTAGASLEIYKIDDVEIS